MNKENQSLLDFLQTSPLASFMVNRPSISNKEAQTLYDLWTKGETDEYGRLSVDPAIDPMQITALTTKGYIRNHPSRYVESRVPKRTLELTDKAKGVIQKIILFEEKSAFEKSSSVIDYEAICRASKVKSKGKVASRISGPGNWLQKVSWK